MAMTRYFFDVIRNASRSYDFHGQYLNGLSQAREMAEIVSFDLACTETDGDAPREIQVRDSAGTNLFSFPVRAQEVVFG